MKIIKVGNKIKECERCGCVMQIEHGDIESEIVRICISEYFCKYEKWEIEYIHCPQCGVKIEVGHKCLK